MASIASTRAKPCSSTSKSLSLLVETKPHKLQVPRGDRTGQVIEPYLTDQWFVEMDEFAKRGLELAENGSVKFVPPNWINTYRHWMENIQDWCISRQLWWGHRIPAWYDEAGNVYVGRDEAEATAKAASANGGLAPALRQDNDVLETWFSSALWPISTHGLAERGGDEGARLRRFRAVIGAGHRLRHHFLLGGPDDHDDRPLHAEEHERR